MILELAKNEYTIQMIIKRLNKHFGGKINGKDFNVHDITKYMQLGKLPDIYGGNRLKWQRKYGFTAITVMTRADCESYNKPTKPVSLDHEKRTKLVTKGVGDSELPVKKRKKRKPRKARRGSKQWRRQWINRRKAKAAEKWNIKRDAS